MSINFKKIIISKKKIAILRIIHFLKNHECEELGCKMMARISFQIWTLYILSSISCVLFYIQNLMRPWLYGRYIKVHLNMFIL
jgi:hypothetical protein